MAVFDFLPSVGNCCFCIPLKLGCIIISICGIVSGLSIGFMLEEYDGSNLKELLETFKFVSTATQAVFCIASALLLIGLIVNWSPPVALWLIVCGVYVIIMLIYAVLGCPLFYSKYNFNANTWARTFTFLLSPLFWIYCIIVVNSFN